MSRQRNNFAFWKKIHLFVQFKVNVENILYDSNLIDWTPPLTTESTGVAYTALR